MATRYEIDFADEASRDLDEVRAFDRQQIVSAIEKHLRFEPTRESRSRIKRMRQPFWSQFRLRADDFRVYYDVDNQRGVVIVLRILRKNGQQTSQEPP